MSVHAWLLQHPNVCNAIYWEKIPGSNASGGNYLTWSANRQNLLQDAYNAIVAGTPTGLVDPPPNLVDPGANDFPQNVISSAHAWDLYVATVAQSLHVEIHDKVDWSILQDTATELAILFDSRQLFAWDATHNGYALDFTLSGCALPAPPDKHWTFLNDAKLISWPGPLRVPVVGPTPRLQLSHRRQTIELVMEWCRKNLHHFTGPYITQAMKDTWQYSGFAPVSRVISGTHGTDYSIPSLNFQHWTAGCHGTNGFLRAVLRAVNIPVQKVLTAGHAQPYFPTEKRYLSHGDDLYNGLGQPWPQGAKEPWTTEALLISEATHEAWYGAGVSDATKLQHIGRRPQELAIELLIEQLLAYYCKDQAAGKSHAQGYLATEVLKGYTLAELDALDLWNKMDAAIAALGGCANIPTV
jgi:hypothetical protein